MKKHIWYLSMILVLLACLGASPAQSGAQIIDATMPIKPEIKTAIESYLTEHPPAETAWYAVTYVENRGTLWYVSLAALASNSEDWNLVEANGNVLWIGTVEINIDEQREFSVDRLGALPAGQPKHASILPAGGGGSYLSFPWEAGKSVFYGTRAIHGDGDYGTTGMYAIDFVSGDDLGVNAAGPNVFASDSGTIDYICDDGTSVAVRTYNETTGDYFVYAHLLDNSSLTMNQSFGHSQKLGTLKYGTFTGSCGWAQQTSRHYHLHWMFTPSNGKFQTESCVLTFSTQKWNCSGTEISPSGWISGGGGSGGGAGNEDDPSTPEDESAVGKTFFDYVIAGMYVVVSVVASMLPTAAETNIFISILNATAVTVRMFFVLVKSNFNMLIPLAAFLVMFVLEIARLIWAIMRLIAKALETIPTL